MSVAIMTWWMQAILLLGWWTPLKSACVIMSPCGGRWVRSTLYEPSSGVQLKLHWRCGSLLPRMIGLVTSWMSVKIIWKRQLWMWYRIYSVDAVTHKAWLFHCCWSALEFQQWRCAFILYRTFNYYCLSFMNRVDSIVCSNISTLVTRAAFTTVPVTKVDQETLLIFMLATRLQWAVFHKSLTVSMKILYAHFQISSIKLFTRLNL